MEIIDEANSMVEHNIKIALSNRKVNHSAVSAIYCDECGEAIAEARRIAVVGCTKCAECQGITELKRKQAGGL